MFRDPRAAGFRVGEQGRVELGAAHLPAIGVGLVQPVREIVFHALAGDVGDKLGTRLVHADRRYLVAQAQALE